MTAKRVLTNITPVAKGYHGWILAGCEVYFAKWHWHLCVASHFHWLWMISLPVQCWLVLLTYLLLVSCSCAEVVWITAALWLKPSVSFQRIESGFGLISALQLKIHWTGCSQYVVLSEPPQLAVSLCQYYLFSTWLTCNLNSLNSNDNRLLCMGSHCIRGQGETDSLFVLCQWSLGPGLIRGTKAYTTPNQLQPGQLNLSQTY